MAGRTVTDQSALTAPENSLIELSTSTSKTLTYREAGKSGVRAVNTLGDIKVGGELPGHKPTPLVKIEGLQTVADAFPPRRASVTRRRSWLPRSPLTSTS